jgi:cation diffusion facilitator family transporter
MHADHIADYQCPRDFGDIPLSRERGARLVVALTVGMMVLELVVGYWTGSLALTADGWHMGTHAGALGITATAYWYARTRAQHRAFSFGTGKVHALAGFTNALILGIVSLTMLYEGATRLLAPSPIRFREALPIAVLGLVVNLVCYRLLHRTQHDHDHDHDDHDTGHERPVAHHDHSHRAALLHVAADAVTSVLAIAALTAGMMFGWAFLDPLMGLVGGLVVLKWSVGLCRSAGGQLLDATASEPLEGEVRTLLEGIDDVRVADIHSWEVGPGRRACIVSLVTAQPRDVADYRKLILARWPFAHLNIEIHRCPHEHPPAQRMPLT